MSEEKHTHVHVLEDGTVIEHSHDHAATTMDMDTRILIQIQKQS